jgi:hypothetical protein
MAKKLTPERGKGAISLVLTRWAGCKLIHGLV